jgi:predicted esterase
MIFRIFRYSPWLFLLFVFTSAPRTFGGLVGHEVLVQNHHCWVIEPPGLPPDAPVVFLLHGLGGKADSFRTECGALRLPPCRFVVPDAPIPYDPLGHGRLHLLRRLADFLLPRNWNPLGYAWYAYRGDREDTVKGRDYLFGLMDRFSKDPPVDGINPKPRPVILMGFSQGAVMALEAGLNYRGPIRAIVSLSGYIWDPSQTLEHPALPRKTPILMFHGTSDTVVREDLHQRTVGALKRAGYKPVVNEWPMGHEITEKELLEVSTFLTALKK